MPEFQLPESVASMNQSLSSSVQYGSLRESRYQRGLCDNFRSRKMNGAGTSDSFQPLGSPMATECHTAIHLNSNLSSSLGGSGLGLLSQRVEGNALPVRNDVEGITRGCHDIKLREANGPPSCARGMGGGHDPLGFDDGATDPAPLSRSLTALDILTRIRGPQGTARREGASAEGARAEGAHAGVPRGGVVVAAREGGSRPLHGGVSPPQCPATGASSDEDEYDDANPDTFEAFDLELEG